MSKIITAFVITILAGTTLLYIENCLFDTENCPFHVSLLTAYDKMPNVTVATITNPVPSSDCTKTRLVDSQLVDDDCQPINPLRFEINYLYRDGGKEIFVLLVRAVCCILEIR